MAEATQAIGAVRQAEVEFYDEPLIGALAEDGEIYMPLNQICGNLNLQLSAQLRRIKRTEALADGLRLITLTAQDDKRRQLVCIRVDLVPGWLAGITTSRIEDDTLRKKLVAYRRDSYKVAWAVFGPLRASAMPAGEIQAMARRVTEVTDRIEAIDQTIASLTALLQDLAGAAEQMKAVNVVVEGLKS